MDHFKIVLALILSVMLTSLFCVSVSTEPNPKSTPLSQPFVVGVNLDTITAIRGYAITVNFDTTILQFSSATRGSLFTGANVGWWRVNTDLPGVVRVECIIFGAGLYVTGPGNLINLTFTAISGEYTDLLISSTELYDVTGVIIPNVTSTNGSIIIGVNPAYTTAKCWLEGPFNNGGMNTTINSILPLASPYTSAPLTVTSIPNNVVDWVLVELRSAYNGVAVKSQSAFLYSDGYIKSPGKPFLVFYNTTPGNYYMVVSHRNHLSVMSHNTVSLVGNGTPTVIDFSNYNNIYGHGGVKQVSTGVYAMAAGDADHNNNVSPSDRNGYWRIQTGLSGYLSADFDLNGNVSPSDLNRYWRVNTGLGTSVPLQ